MNAYLLVVGVHVLPSWHVGLLNLGIGLGVSLVVIARVAIW